MTYVTVLVWQSNRTLCVLCFVNSKHLCSCKMLLSWWLLWGSSGDAAKGCSPTGEQITFTAPSFREQKGDRCMCLSPDRTGFYLYHYPTLCKCVSLLRSQNHLVPGNPWISDHWVRDIRSPAFSMSHAQTAAAYEQYDFWPETKTVSRTAEWK